MSKQAIFMFKPDALETICPVEGHDLHVVATRLFTVASLEIIDYSEDCLTVAQVKDIYAKALRPNPDDDAVWGTEWKDEVLRHISSGLVTSYLLEGNDAFEKARGVKRYLRGTYVADGDIIRNVAHVPDPDEFPVVKRIIFEAFNDEKSSIG